jgi:hypothetical protein
MNIARIARLLGGACALAVLAAAPVEGQVADDARWRATPQVGFTLYDDATPFKNAPFVGGEIAYNLNPMLRFGFGLGVARPIVDGSYYPLFFFRPHVDTTMLFQVGQQVTQVNYAAHLSAGTALGMANVYGLAGVGGYTFFLDRQVMYTAERVGAANRFSGLLVPLGVGLGFNFGETAAIRLEARNDMMMNFDREVFNPVEPRFQNRCSPGFDPMDYCWADANATPPEAKDTNHNLRFILGFELVPGRR